MEINFEGLVVSQTMIKDLERDETCPYRWKRLWIDKDIVTTPTEPMKKGLYFEQQVIGASAKDDETPRGKGVAWDRIDKQAEKAKNMLDLTHPDFEGIDADTAQMVLMGTTDTIFGVNFFRTFDNVAFRGVVDIFGRVVKTNAECHVDLKFTKDLMSTYGDYSWGNPESRDYLQQILYMTMHKQIRGVLPESFLYIFDESPRMNVSVIKLDTDDFDFGSLFDRVDSFAQAVDYYQDNEYPYNPSEKECESCPLKDTCEKALRQGEIQRKVLPIRQI